MVLSTFHIVDSSLTCINLWMYVLRWGIDQGYSIICSQFTYYNYLRVHDLICFLQLKKRAYVFDLVKEKNNNNK